MSQSYGAKLIVSNIPKNMTWFALKDFIALHANGIKHVTVSQSRGSVEFESSELANEAMEALASQKYEGQQLEIRKYVPVVNVRNPKKGVTVRGLSPLSDWRDLKDELSVHGAIRYADVVKEGVAVVEYYDEEGADKAVADSGVEIDGEPVTIERYSEPTGQVYRKLFFANLPYSMAKEDLERLISKHAGSAAVTMLYGDNGNPRGFARVTVDDPQETSKLISELNGISIEGRELLVRADRYQD